MKTKYLAVMLVALVFLSACGDDPAGDLQVPGQAAITPADRSLMLDWDPVPGATGYEVWYNTNMDPQTALLSGTTLAGTNHVIANVTNTATYYIWLKARYGDRTSGFGPMATAAGGYPAVMTLAVTGELRLTRELLGTNAMVSGMIVDSGLSPVTIRGVCWSTNPYPTIRDFNATNPEPGPGSYDITLRGLQPATWHYARAFAANSNGIAYGNSVRFHSGHLPGTYREGGYVFYNDGTGGGMVAATNYLVRSAWTTLNEGHVYAFTEASPDFGTGPANSLAIIGQEGHQASAAQHCLAYSGGGYTNWFLPSQQELFLVFMRLVVNEIIPPTVLVWSSSEDDAVPENGKACIFYSGEPWSVPKNATNIWCIPARSFGE